MYQNVCAVGEKYSRNSVWQNCAYLFLDEQLKRLDKVDAQIESD